MSYNLEEGTVNGKPFTTAVWWQVPCAGLFTDRVEAVKAAKALDLNPQTCVRACPVAIVNDASYEVLM